MNHGGLGLRGLILPVPIRPDGGKLAELPRSRKNRTGFSGVPKRAAGRSDSVGEEGRSTFCIAACLPVPKA